MAQNANVIIVHLKALEVVYLHTIGLPSVVEDHYIVDLGQSSTALLVTVITTLGTWNI